MKKFYFKRQMFFFTFIISFYILNGQVITDNFENENILNWTQSNPNDWITSNENPITSNYSLKHNLTNIAGISYISQQVDDLDLSNKNTSWQFNIKNGNWDPSSSNKFWVYVTADRANLNSEETNGYAVGVNLSGSTDIITLWKVTNGNAEEAIITSTINWGSGETKGIKVTRNTTGQWQLFIDNDGGFDNLISQGTNTNIDYLFSNYFGLHYTYTATRAGLLWLDDVLIENTVPVTKPTINFSTTTSIENEPDTPSNILIPISLTNYENDVTVNITTNNNSTAENEDFILHTNNITFTSNGTQNISLTINNDDDFEDETVIINITTNSDALEITNQTYTLTIIDNDIPIIINEIHADPDSVNGDANGDGVVSSSQDEFIEIYNNSNTELNISGWTLEDASRERHIFPENTIIPINQTIVLFSGGTPTNIPGLVQTASTGSLVLNNTADTIIIKNELGIEILIETYDNTANNNQSIARSEDLFGEFVTHSSITTNPLLFSPGRNNDTNLLFSSNTLHTTQQEHLISNLTIYQSANADLVIKNLNAAAHLSIYSISGETIYTSNITAKNINTITIPIPISSFYIIKLTTDTHNLFLKKMYLNNF